MRCGTGANARKISKHQKGRGRGEKKTAPWRAEGPFFGEYSPLSLFVWSAHLAGRLPAYPSCCLIVYLFVILNVSVFVCLCVCRSPLIPPFLSAPLYVLTSFSVYRCRLLSHSFFSFSVHVSLDLHFPFFLLRRTQPQNMPSRRLRRAPGSNQLHSVPFHSARFVSLRFITSPCGFVRFRSVRFGSVRFRSSTNVSVMFSWFRSVRFGLIRFRSIPFDSVRFRFDWFHLVFHSFPVSSVRLCSVPLNPSRFHSVPFVSVRFRPILVGFIPIGFIQSLNPFQSVRFGSISESFHLVMFHSVPFGSVRFHSDLSSRVYFSPFDRGPFHLVVFCSIRFPFHSARLTLEDENQAALYGVFQR